MKKLDMNRIAIIGIGNVSRQDDGLGWAFLEKLNISKNNIDTYYKYLLSIEDAELISHYDTVFFIDATKNHFEKGISFDVVQPDLYFQPFSHYLNPPLLVYLCESLFHHYPHTYLLQIEGYQWELKEELSPRANKNLENALIFFEKYFEKSVLSAA